MSYSASAGNEPDRYYLIDGLRPAENRGMLSGAGEAIGSSIALVDEWLGARVVLELDTAARILRAPVETISLSEDGFERNYQGSQIMLVWEFSGIQEWRTTFTQRILKEAGR
jgi:alpha-amylase